MNFYQNEQNRICKSELLLLLSFSSFLVGRILKIASLSGEMSEVFMTSKGEGFVGNGREMNIAKQAK